MSQSAIVRDVKKKKNIFDLLGEQVRTRRELLGKNASGKVIREQHMRRTFKLLSEKTGEKFKAAISDFKKRGAVFGVLGREKLKMGETKIITLNVHVWEINLESYSMSFSLAVIRKLARGGM